MSRRGNTLIELLIVLVMILVVLAILFALGRSATARARRIVTLSHVRDSSMAFYLRPRADE